MPQKIVLCGPPGIGKTTTARKIRQLRPKINVIELEQLGDRHDEDKALAERKAIMKLIADSDQIGDVIMTCANVDIPVFFPALKVVFMWTDDKEIYLKRKVKRDEDEGYDDDQGHDQWYESLKTHVARFKEERGYLVLDDMTQTPDKWAEKVIAWMDELNGQT